MNSNNIPFTNEFNIRSQISAKKASQSAYHSTATDVLGVITDQDTFPYPRYFRGVPQSDIPIIAEREAGWRCRNNICKIRPVISDINYPNHCFQGSCSTIYPCYPKNLNKYDDKYCTVQFR
jgi:hypothetical protein